MRIQYKSHILSITFFSSDHPQILKDPPETLTFEGTLT